MENARRLQQDLSAVYDEFIDLLNKFSDEDINTVPFKDSWTPGQVATHIIKATSGVPDKQTVPADRPPDQNVKDIENTFLDFNIKMKSPDFILPGDGPFEKAVLLQKFNKLKERHSKDILEKDLTRICVGFNLPDSGPLTRYEWYRFFVVHGKRHLHQLKNILQVIKK